MYRIGIIGAGSIASSHTEASILLPQVKLAAVADINEDKAKALAEKYGMAPYKEYIQMLDEQQLDIVIINLPHFLHREACLESAIRRVHILMEKPMALDESQCKDMMDAAQKNGVKLFIGHPMRYSDFNIKARDIIRSGKLGSLRYIHEKRYTDYFEASRPGWFLKKETAGGGIAFNLGVHFFDKIQWVTDSRIKCVTANVDYSGSSYKVEGSAHVYVKLENGVTASLMLNGYSPADEYLVEYIFTEGALKVDPYEKIIEYSKGGSREIMLDLGNTFKMQLLDMISCIENDTRPEIDGEYGKHIIRSIRAVYESAENNRPVDVV